MKTPRAAVRDRVVEGVEREAHRLAAPLGDQGGELRVLAEAVARQGLRRRGDGIAARPRSGSPDRRRSGAAGSTSSTGSWTRTSFCRVRRQDNLPSTGRISAGHMGLAASENIEQDHGAHKFFRLADALHRHMGRGSLPAAWDPRASPPVIAVAMMPGASGADPPRRPWRNLIFFFCSAGQRAVNCGEGALAETG